MMNRSNVLEIKDARLAELIEQNQTLQKERAALEQERAAMQACTRMPGHRTPLCTQTRNRADAPVRLELCYAAAMQADVEQAHDLYQSNQQHVTALQAENVQLRLQLFEAGAPPPPREQERLCSVLWRQADRPAGYGARG